ncbi:hypothetical protein D3C85_936770 [compost metagenome]
MIHNTLKIKHLIAALVLGGFTALLSGCFDSEPKVVALPEINNSNCKPAIIKSIEPLSAREKFSGECARRSAAKVRTSPAQEW